MLLHSKRTLAIISAVALLAVLIAIGCRDHLPGTPATVARSGTTIPTGTLHGTSYPLPSTGTPQPPPPTSGAYPPPQGTPAHTGHTPYPLPQDSDQPDTHLPLVFLEGRLVTPTPTLTPSRTPTPTVTPTPTPTPIPWPPALDAPGPSKLGLHVQWNNQPDIMEFVRRYRPAVMKGVGDLGYTTEIKWVSPETVVVGRVEGHEPQLEGDPVQAARAYVAANLERYLSYPGVDYWEGINEPVVTGRMPWYAAFEAERTRVMAEQGLRTAVGSFSTGTPEWEEFREFRPAIQAAHTHRGILTVHEYDAPTMARTVGMALPGRPAFADRGVLTLRYRWWYEDFIKPWGYDVPLVISEVGVDGGVRGRPGPEDGHGWRDFATYWGERGLTADSTAYYLDQLSWYDHETRRDDYVIGSAIFTVGAMSDHWASFDVTDMLRQLAKLLIAHAGQP